MRSKPWRRQAQAAFTLAELLVVIAIIGIMFAIALPTFTNMTGQTKLEAAANSLYAAAQMARQHAVANNQPAYLVLNSGQTAPELAYRAFAVFTIDIHTPPVSASSGFYLQDWTPLPVGILFDAESYPNDNVFIPNTGRSWNGGLNENSQLKIDGQTYNVIGFRPDGKTSSYFSWNRKLLLAEGTLSGSTLVRTSGEGKEIRFKASGEGSIIDLFYGESTDPEEAQL